MEEFKDINDIVPDFEAELLKRIGKKKESSSFDPYKLMVKKKEDGNFEVNQDSIQNWPEKDIKELEEYCKKMGVVGFSCGRMSPLLALKMLKKQLGDLSDNSIKENIQQKSILLG